MMYDKTKHNIILLTDATDMMTMQKALGTYKIAYELRQAGFQVVVLNHLHVFSLEEVFHYLKELVNEKTLFVGINNIFYQQISEPIITEENNIYYTPSKPGAMLPHGLDKNDQLVKYIKELNPNCALVLGGASAHDAYYNKEYDYIVTGYADLSVVNLARHLQDKSVLIEKSHRSIFGPIIITDSKADGFNFSQSTMRYEPQDGILKGEVLPIEIARGCIFKCTFCSYPLNGKKKLDYVKDSEILYREFIDNYEKFGTTRYSFVDDTFNDSLEKCKMIYDISKRLPFKLEYWAYIRLDLLAAHPKTIDWLFDSGLRGCFFGIETFNQATGSLIGKGGKRERIIETLRYIMSRWGNESMLHGSFIFGLPHESLNSMQQTVDILLSPDSPLDSFHLKALRIKANKDNWTNGFLADIDINFEKYGYQNLGATGLDMLWKNEHTSYEQVKQIVNDTHEAGNRAGTRVISSSYVFDLASLGYPLSYVANKIVSEFDWHETMLRKASRAKEYKTRLCVTLNINPFEQATEKV